MQSSRAGVLQGTVTTSAEELRPGVPGDPHPPPAGYLELEDGTRFFGKIFGSVRPSDGEVVFNTGMVGYVESLTDPSYRGQILALTYPLVGSYGVPDFTIDSLRFESDKIQVRGLVVANYIDAYSHWEARGSLGRWLAEQGIVGLAGVDTRELTRILRSRGTMLGRIVLGEGTSGGGVWAEGGPVEATNGLCTRVASATADQGPPADLAIRDPNASDLVAEVTCKEVVTDPVPAVSAVAAKPHAARTAPRQSSSVPRESATPHIVVVDCGCKRSIGKQLRDRRCRLTIVPYDHDFSAMQCDGILLSNGPGDPAMCKTTVRNVAKVLARAAAVTGMPAGVESAESGVRTQPRTGRHARPRHAGGITPIAGICLGNQILALAAGARTYKLPFGHRGQNQPVQQVGTERCYITSQNHGYAVDAESLPDGWEVWYTNLNDGTVEGVRHVVWPFFAVQFHPEGAPGPIDSLDFFDRFVEATRNA